jgi:hypothetical protein
MVWINILAWNIYQAIKSSVTHYEDNIDWMCSDQQLQCVITNIK